MKAQHEPSWYPKTQPTTGKESALRKAHLGALLLSLKAISETVLIKRCDDERWAAASG
jgi:hypothetical protein